MTTSSSPGRLNGSGIVHSAPLRIRAAGREHLERRSSLSKNATATPKLQELPLMQPAASLFVRQEPSPAECRHSNYYLTSSILR